MPRSSGGGRSSGGSGGGNAWNSFQKSQGGQGLSRSEMSAMYQASKSAAASPSYSSSYSSAPVYASSSYSHAPAPARAPAAAAAAPSNPWNAYQQAVAGQGLSRAEISAGYQAAKAASSNVSASAASAAASRAYPVAVSARAAYAAPAAVPAPSRAALRVLNWHEYRAANKGLGLSVEDLSRGYQLQKTGAGPAARPSSSAAVPAPVRAPAVAAAAPIKVKGVNPWNAFRQANRGKGWSPQRMAVEYRAANNGAAVPHAQRKLPVALRDVDEDLLTGLRANQDVVDMDFADEIIDDHRRQQQARPVAAGNMANETVLAALQRQVVLAAAEAKGEPVVASESALERLKRSLPANLPQVSWNDLNVDPRVIGRGGFGQVHRGTWRGVPVAVKALHQSSMASRARQELLQECTVLTQLRHPNIVQLLAVCVDDGHLALVLEFVDSGSLFEALYITERLFSLQDKWHMIRDLISGLQYLHNRPQPLVHRDIKPQNVLLTMVDGCHLKITDFGLAKLRNRASQSLSSSVPGAQSAFAGTFCYAAPEVLRGELYSERSDMYSLALVAYELLTEQAPYEDIAAVQMQAQVGNKGVRPAWPREANDASSSAYVPAAARAIIEQTWTQDPSRRISAEQMLSRWMEVAPQFGVDLQQADSPARRAYSQSNAGSPAAPSAGARVAASAAASAAGGWQVISSGASGQDSSNLSTVNEEDLWSVTSVSSSDVARDRNRLSAAAPSVSSLSSNATESGGVRRLSAQPAVAAAARIASRPSSSAQNLQFQ